MTRAGAPCRGRRASALLALAAGASLTSGCVAAAIPAVAAGAIGKGQLAHRKPKREKREVARPAVVASAPAPAPIPAGPPPGMQYLYGSGEGAAISVQAWRTLFSYLAHQVLYRPTDSAVLAPDATLSAPKFVACGQKPFAAVFDVDETVLLNLGFESDAAAHPGPYDEARWQAWERTGAGAVAATPGAVGAMDAIRSLGVTPVFITNRSAANAAATEAALERAGLGAAKHGDTLFLAGDDATGAHKDARRATVAAKYCVLAMAGDQLGDFSDLFNAGLATPARRDAVLGASVSRLWGQGWFVLPNPVYGTAIKGDTDEVFPRDKRWTPPAR